MARMMVRELGAPSAVQLAGHLVRHSVGTLAGGLVDSTAVALASPSANESDLSSVLEKAHAKV